MALFIVWKTRIILGQNQFYNTQEPMLVLMTPFILVYFTIFNFFM